MASVMDTVRGAITPELVQGASRTLGEDASAVQNTLNAAVPTLLAGVIKQSSTPSGATQLFTSITASKAGTDSSAIASTLIGGGSGADGIINTGQSTVSQLLGGKTGSITDTLARAGGVQRASATRILAMAAPIVMSVLSRQIASRNLDANSFTKMLAGERDEITRALPPGVDRDLGVEETVTTTTRTATTYESAPKPKRRSATPWVLGGLAALALLFLLNRGGDEEVVVNVTPAAERPAVPIQPAVPLAERAAPISELEGFIVTTTAGSTPRAFLVERVTFDGRSTEISTTARTALSSVAGLLAANPNARIRIEVHTDSEGDAAANRQLAQDRADAIKQALVAQGASADQITAEGVGSARPIASNDTEAGRAQNRRVELIVVQR